ncbi:non-ribosomal peptide synthetase [Falsiroseomonas sp.]|uniref:non-ribosomal peptide synthetase n=1 Tax=Falsiroseomonas sp. TaxID=2870721 RepID=UPI003F6F77F2
MIPFERAEFDGTIPARLRRIVAALPAAEALVEEGRSLTYAALDAESDRAAAALRDLPQGSVVALVFGIGMEAIIALLGALKAGVPAMPIDPAAPPEDVIGLLAQVARIVTAPAQEAWCRDHAGSTPVQVGVPADAPGGIARTPRPEDPAIIYLTSASTGPAKGVVRPQRSLCWHAGLQTRHHGYAPGDRIAHLSSFAYAGAIPAILGGLLAGATVEVFDSRRHGLLALGRWAAARRITVLPVTPPVLRDLVEARLPERQAWQPRRIIVGGEVLRPEDVTALRERLGWDCPVVNRLASSEAGMIAEWVVDPAACQGREVVPVGFAVEERGVAVLDEQGMPVPPGEVGEIVVSGDYLALGYWQRPELTAERFRPDPQRPGGRRLFTGDLGRLHPDGLLEHLGRADHMVKIRGYRVELAAVEAVLCRQEGVAEGVVQAVRMAGGDLRLAAWVQPVPGATISAPGLRQRLASVLPDYMVPWRVGVFAALPRSAGGKIARGRLPPLRGARPQGMPPAVPPRGATERLLAGLWATLFEVDEIGREDDFFELGGDSLDMLQVAAGLYEQRSVFITDADLLEHPRLADMAAAVDRHADQAAQTA